MVIYIHVLNVNGGLKFLKYFWKHKCIERAFGIDYGEPYLHEDVQICGSCTSPNLNNLPLFSKYMKELMYFQKKFRESPLTENNHTDFPDSFFFQKTFI